MRKSPRLNERRKCVAESQRPDRRPKEAGADVQCLSELVDHVFSPAARSDNQPVPLSVVFVAASAPRQAEADQYQPR